MAPWLERLGRWKAMAVYQKAARHCPAYREFLNQHSISPDKPIEWSSIPITTKENYVKAHSIEKRCYGGSIPLHGTTVDESGGSSGPPSNWVRTKPEREHLCRLLRMSFKQYFRPTDRVMVLNCTAMGPWGAGILLSTALADVAIVKSVGPDILKLENTLRTFGPNYRYVVVGYPPFLKEFVGASQLDLSAYDMTALIGAEAHSEVLRDLLLQTFRNVMSCYGAADLELNLGMETPFTIGLRRWLRTNPIPCQELFGCPEPPMIFQYNPGDHLVETDADGNLMFTICRTDCAAPRIRYNIQDLGGTMPFGDLVQRLKMLGVSPANFSPRTSALPLLWLRGRSDLVVAFFGGNIYPRNIETVLDQDPALRSNIHSFQLKIFEDARLTEHLMIRLEKAPGVNGELQVPALHALFLQELAKCNQDFRHAFQLLPKEHLVIELHDFGTGPFAGREKRVKNKYIA
jgi:phenylacetate-CoA ligase